MFKNHRQRQRTRPLPRKNINDPHVINPSHKPTHTHPQLSSNTSAMTNSSPHSTRHGNIHTLSSSRQRKQTKPHHSNKQQNTHPNHSLFKRTKKSTQLSSLSHRGVSSMSTFPEDDVTLHPTAMSFPPQQINIPDDSTLQKWVNDFTTTKTQLIVDSTSTLLPHDSTVVPAVLPTHSSSYADYINYYFSSPGTHPNAIEFYDINHIHRQSLPTPLLPPEEMYNDIKGHQGDDFDPNDPKNKNKKNTHKTVDLPQSGRVTSSPLHTKPASQPTRNRAMKKSPNAYLRPHFHHFWNFKQQPLLPFTQRFTHRGKFTFNYPPNTTKLVTKTIPFHITENHPKFHPSYPTAKDHKLTLPYFSIPQVTIGEYYSPVADKTITPLVDIDPQGLTNLATRKRIKILKQQDYSSQPKLGPIESFIQSERDNFIPIDDIVSKRQMEFNLETLQSYIDGSLIGKTPPRHAFTHEHEDILYPSTENLPGSVDADEDDRINTQSGGKDVENKYYSHPKDPLRFKRVLPPQYSPDSYPTFPHLPFKPSIAVHNNRSDLKGSIRVEEMRRWSRGERFRRIDDEDEEEEEVDDGIVQQEPNVEQQAITQTSQDDNNLPKPQYTKDDLKPGLSRPKEDPLPLPFSTPVSELAAAEAKANNIQQQEQQQQQQQQKKSNLFQDFFATAPKQLDPSSPTPLIPIPLQPSGLSVAETMFQEDKAKNISELSAHHNTIAKTIQATNHTNKPGAVVQDLTPQFHPRNQEAPLSSFDMRLEPWHNPNRSFVTEYSDVYLSTPETPIETLVRRTMVNSTSHKKYNYDLYRVELLPAFLKSQRYRPQMIGSDGEMITSAMSYPLERHRTIKIHREDVDLLHTAQYPLQYQDLFSPLGTQYDPTHPRPSTTLVPSDLITTSILKVLSENSLQRDFLPPQLLDFLGPDHSPDIIKHFDTLRTTIQTNSGLYSVGGIDGNGNRLQLNSNKNFNLGKIGNQFSPDLLFKYALPFRMMNIEHPYPSANAAATFQQLREFKYQHYNPLLVDFGYKQNAIDNNQMLERANDISNFIELDVYTFSNTTTRHDPYLQSGWFDNILRKIKNSEYALNKYAQLPVSTFNLVSTHFTPQAVRQSNLKRWSEQGRDQVWSNEVKKEKEEMEKQNNKKGLFNFKKKNNIRLTNDQPYPAYLNIAKADQFLSINDFCRSPDHDAILHGAVVNKKTKELITTFSATYTSPYDPHLQGYNGFTSQLMIYEMIRAGFGYQQPRLQSDGILGSLSQLFSPTHLASEVINTQVYPSLPLAYQERFRDPTPM